jgi:hypothetical protein
MLMEFNAQRVSPSPQELDSWLRSTELDDDGGCVDGEEMFGGGTSSRGSTVGFVCPEISPEIDDIALERTRSQLYDAFTSSRRRHPDEFRLPFSQQDLEPLRRASLLDDGTNSPTTCSSPRVVSSQNCFVMALERSQESQAEIDRRFDSSSDDYSRRNSFNAALLTTRTRRMLLDSSAALFSSSTNTTTASEGIQSNGLRPPYEYHFGRRPNHVANMGEDSHASSPSPLTQQVDLDWNFHGQHHHQQQQQQQNSGRAVGNSSGTRSNRVNSWTHRDMLSMLRTLADDNDNDIATKRRCSTGDLYPEDAVRAELLRIEREQLEYEEARLGL